MGLWQQLLTGRKHRELPPQAQDSAMVAVPPGFEEDSWRAGQLMDQMGQDPSVIAQLIQVYEQVVERLRPDEAPLYYAVVQNNLGAAYYQLPTGDLASNLAKAMAHWKQALRFWTPDVAPFRYAAVHNNLGEVYRNLPAGDQVNNLKQAIACYQEALRFRTPEATPRDYAITQHNLGRACFDLSVENQTNDMKQAIACYQEALHFWTPETAPQEYAAVQHDLGLAHRELPTGDRAKNLVQAIACFREALRFRTPEATPFAYATTQNHLGGAYRRLPTGDQTKNLVQAIACYREALRCWTPDTAPQDYASIQNNLGLAHHNLPTGDRASNLEHAIACYQEALRFWTPEGAPLDYALVQNNLGAAYLNLPTGDRASNLEHAIACYQEALRFYTAEVAPFEYATIQNNLGSIYSQFPTGDRARHLEQAMARLQQALRFQTPETAPFQYARAQSNLGVAYLNLPIGDRASNLEQAMTCCQEALRFYTAEATPHDYAMAQNNLGAAYLNLRTGDRASNLEHAIACFQQALRLWTPEAAPLDYAMAQTNLGSAYYYLGKGDRASNLEQAIACYQKALRFYTPETAPFKYALAQTNLGSVYRDLPAGDRARHLEQAMACYQEALRIWTPETAPHDYATVQNHLGLVYFNLPIEDQARQLEEAISCYQEALRFQTPETDPYGCRATNNNLAQLYFNHGMWHDALRAYRVAMRIEEQLYRSGLSTSSKAAEVSGRVVFYSYAAFAAVRCGEIAEAFLILEQSKTRLLSDALRLHVRRPPHVPDARWSAFEEAGAVVRATQAEQTPLRAAGQDSVQVYAARVQAGQAANAALDSAIAQVRTYAPQFLAAFDRSTLVAQLPDRQTALISFCITERGSMGLIVSQHEQEGVQVIEMPTFTEEDLRRLFIATNPEGLAPSWFEAYRRFLRNGGPSSIEHWQETITQVLAVLSEQVFAPIVSALPADIKKLILMPSGALFQFPLHAVPLPGDHSEVLGERYQVSYAPSFEVLVEAQARVRQDVTPELYAVINPQNDPRLLFTPFEGEAIARLFDRHTVDAGQAGTKAQVLAGAQGQTYIHFSCHGSYNWYDPPASGLDLADGRLTVADLQQGTIDLSMVRLVTLSACETGITDVLGDNAEEYVGIPSGFLLAGVPCVVCSLWAVPDLSTALLMERFYRNHLKRRMGLAAALRDAQWLVRTLEIGAVAEYAEHCYQQAQQREKAALFQLMRYYRHLAEQDPTMHPFAHPYYWAAFTVNGL